MFPSSCRVAGQDLLRFVYATVNWFGSVFLRSQKLEEDVLTVLYQQPSRLVFFNKEIDIKFINWFPSYPYFSYRFLFFLSICLCLKVNLIHS